MTLPAPIAGVQNKYWFNYRTDVAEARKELAHDLRHATDAEDERDAWDEYRAELADARRDYAKEMREKGDRSGHVRVAGSDRKSVGEGRSVSVRGKLGGRRPSTEINNT